jgi:hypothetical protein
VSSRCGGLFGFFIATAVPETVLSSLPTPQVVDLIQKKLSKHATGARPLPVEVALN